MSISELSCINPSADSFSLLIHKVHQMIYILSSGICQFFHPSDKREVQLSCYGLSARELLPNIEFFQVSAVRVDSLVPRRSFVANNTDNTEIN